MIVTVPRSNKLLRFSLASTKRYHFTTTRTYRRTLFGFPHEFKEQKYTLHKTIHAKPRELYDIACEVSQYSKFIPYCVESFVDERNSSNNNRPTVAGLRIGFREYDEKFVCNVNCQEVINKENKDNRSFIVEADSLSQHLFDSFHSEWLIQPHPRRGSDFTRVELALRFKFKSRLYNAVSSIFARSVTKVVMDAFERRVHDLKRLEMSRTISTMKTVEADKEL
ncbi:ubiquinone-binding protein COQ10 NDAI_0C02710 [Naumovozyma dairenensis CBS 421]|uniref:Coenzyme Q-binding protein COQ10 START domain-containing protein n=1 Tax=Naumovozyma dairenensis (strain ATCC 10597 / BCRC 20456 / CBS 421 / NBRC 0211 / NRRL Y-12639) TaxID=1071378 RepID=G0W820_NAUDC|nr:hypothetical protein NDAI_0C02710 [Naumovozyma dairenensis CBS 421]CCD23931.1 hypothetical protein NDAI_0C02710 [Naumovozyma dairenensis CBS 421]